MVAKDQVPVFRRTGDPVKWIETRSSHRVSPQPEFPFWLPVFGESITGGGATPRFFQPSAFQVSLTLRLSLEMFAANGIASLEFQGRIWQTVTKPAAPRRHVTSTVYSARSHLCGRKGERSEGGLSRRGF